MKDKTAKEVLEAVFWDQAQPKVSNIGHLSKFDPSTGNLPVVDTKGGPVTLQISERVVVDIDGKQVGAIVIESQDGAGDEPGVIFIKTTTGVRLRIMRGLGLLGKLGLE